MVEQRQEELVRIPAAIWQAKYASKREQFNFLTQQAKAWLPSYETVTIYWLKDLVNGKKKCK